MNRVLQFAKIAIATAVVITLGFVARAENERANLEISIKGETHAASAQVKADEHLLAMDAHQLAMIGGIRASQSGELIAAYSKAANELNDAAGKLGKVSGSVNDFLASDDFHGMFENAVTASRTANDLIREARDTAGESKKTQQQFQQTLAKAGGTLDASKTFLDGPLTKSTDSATRLLTPMGLFVSDMQFKEHQFFFGKGCPAEKQDCPKEKMTFWQRSLAVINAARGYTQPGYYAQRMVTGQ